MWPRCLKALQQSRRKRSRRKKSQSRIAKRQSLKRRMRLAKRMIFRHLKTALLPKKTALHRAQDRKEQIDSPEQSARTDPKDRISRTALPMGQETVPIINLHRRMISISSRAISSAWQRIRMMTIPSHSIAVLRHISPIKMQR